MTSTQPASPTPRHAPEQGHDHGRHAAGEQEQSVPVTVKAVDLALNVISGYERPDLEARLHQARERLLDEHLRVLVIGEFKQGKSMLVNGLVSAPVCPVYDDVATSVPTVVQHGERATVTLVREHDDGTDTDRAQRRVERVEIGVDELEDRISERGNPGNEQRWSYAEVEIPRRALAGGLKLVDTPGVGGLNSVHGAATMAAMPAADAVVLVSDASQEYTAPELEFLRQAKKVCPNVACVLTKIDLYPQWRRIAELDRAHLAMADIDAELLCVSSTLRVQSIKTQDPALNDESGFPELERFIAQRVVGQAGLLARRSTVHDVGSVTEQLAGSLRAERAILQDPGTAQQTINQLTEAKQRAAALKERSARWQQTLSDGVADLNADVDYDLRDRMREITRQAEEEVNNGGDPKKTWTQLSTWIEQEVSAAASANFLWSIERARWLAGQVAEHFAEDAERVPPKLRSEFGEPLSLVRDMQLREGEPFGIGQKAYTVARGSYVGVIMGGLLGTAVGIGLFNPLALGAGVVLGGKALTDERRRIVTRRQNEAKAVIRRYVDDVIFQVGKESKDVLRRMQRDVRDHYTAEAEEMDRSMKDSLANAEKAAKAAASGREQRLAEIKTALERLESLQQKVRTLTPKEEPAQQPAEQTTKEPAAVTAGQNG